MKKATILGLQQADDPGTLGRRKMGKGPKRARHATIPARFGGLDEQRRPESPGRRWLLMPKLTHTHPTRIMSQSADTREVPRTMPRCIHALAVELGQKLQESATVARASRKVSSGNRSSSSSTTLSTKTSKLSSRSPMICTMASENPQVRLQSS
ncbi:hypothetical protein ACWHA1_15885 [Streptomyces decoyicus]